MGFSEELQALLEKYGAFGAQEATNEKLEDQTTNTEMTLNTDTEKQEMDTKSSVENLDTQKTESTSYTEGQLKETIVNAIKDALHYKEMAPEKNPVEEFLYRPDGPLARRKARNSGGKDKNNAH